MLLKTLVPGQIWYAQQAIQFGPLNLSTRATFVKLRDGSIWVHSPIEPSAQLVTEIAKIGPVRYVLAPNKSHHLFFTSFILAFPNAQGYIAPGLAEKRPDLGVYPELSPLEKPAWTTELIANLHRSHAPRGNAAPDALRHPTVLLPNRHSC
ncbi:DUF4336 domain-containing protein [Methylomonas sp. BW4-1]|uniref:DUF4336 domain-containing protein n=1 Tax=Methylomonas sp. BW4-1 TaxID=3376685 RepID=UPI004042EC11